MSGPLGGGDFFDSHCSCVGVEPFCRYLP